MVSTTEWKNIPTQKDALSMYALLLPIHTRIDLFLMVQERLPLKRRRRARIIAWGGAKRNPRERLIVDQALKERQMLAPEPAKKRIERRDTRQSGLRTSCMPDRAEPSWTYFQAGGLRQIDLILVEGQQLSCFEMNCRGQMKNIQQPVTSGHCET